jgi:hypothetical protein
MTANTGPTWPSSEHDPLPIGGGRKVGDVDTATLTGVLERLNIPGFSHSSGRQSNIEAYKQEHDRVHDAAGKAAVAEWLAGAM